MLWEVDCEPGTCQPEQARNFGRPRLVRSSQVLRYEFICTGDPATVEDECADDTPDGATIEIGYEPIAAP